MTAATAVRAHPIIFSAPMVRALLDARKTQTRRVVSRREKDEGEWATVRPDRGYTPETVAAQYRCPYGAPGDLLWVRETFSIRECGSRVPLAPATWPHGWPTDRVEYAADRPPDLYIWNKRPAIFMPGWASRIALEITALRVERLQEISEADAIAEGVEKLAADNATHRAEYMRTWDALNQKRGYGWNVNPWVWVISFRLVPHA